MAASACAPTVHGWGRDGAGPIGDGTTGARATPVRVLSPDRRATAPDPGPSLIAEVM